METKDVATLLVSLLALGVSGGTWYFNVLKKAALKVVAGDEVSLHYLHDGKLLFTSNFAVFNEGARAGALLRLSGTISSSSEARTSDFRWRSFTESKNIGNPGEAVQRVTNFKKWAQTIAISGHSAVVEGIACVTENPFELTKGDYVVEFTGMVGPKRRELPQGRYAFHVTSEGAQFLIERGTANSEGVVSAMLRLHLLPYTQHKVERKEVESKEMVNLS